MKNLNEVNNLKNIFGIISWRSKKNSDGTFTASVISIEYQKPLEVHFQITRPTRAQAVSRIKKAVRFAKVNSLNEIYKTK